MQARLNCALEKPSSNEPQKRKFYEKFCSIRLNSTDAHWHTSRASQGEHTENSQLTYKVQAVAMRARQIKRERWTKYGIWGQWNPRQMSQLKNNDIEDHFSIFWSIRQHERQHSIHELSNHPKATHRFFSSQNGNTFHQNQFYPIFFLAFDSK